MTAAHAPVAAASPPSKIRLHPTLKHLLRLAPVRRIFLARLVSAQFVERFGRPLDYRNPATFTEKINWAKVHGRLERLAPFVDKHRVRRHIAATVGPDLLAPQLAVASGSAGLDWDALPPSFVLKASHGSGWNILVPDKTAADRAAIGRRLDEWMRKRFFFYGLETQYLPIPPRIVAEEFIGDPASAPADHKIHCVGGEPRYIQTDFDRFGRHTQSLHDLHWRRLRVRLQHAPADFDPPRPAALDRMLDIARRLSAPFPYVRVDLYDVDGRVYFGELTFTPNTGMTLFDPPEFDLELGRDIDLAGYARRIPCLG